MCDTKQKAGRVQVCMFVRDFVRYHRRPSADMSWWWPWWRVRARGARLGQRLPRPPYVRHPKREEGNAPRRARQLRGQRDRERDFHARSRSFLGTTARGSGRAVDQSLGGRTRAVRCLA